MAAPLLSLSLYFFGTMNAFEIVAAGLGLVYLLFEYKASPWMWLFSILMSGLYAYVFFLQGMYANFVLSLYNIGISVWGGYSWVRRRQVGGDAGAIRSFPRRWWPVLVGAVVLLAPLLAWVLRWMGESEVPLLDGLTASLSVVGIWMLAKKYYQQWFCWIVADGLYVAMFVHSGMWPSTVLYGVYVVVAVLGVLHWRRQMARTE